MQLRNPESIGLNVLNFRFSRAGRDSEDIEPGAPWLTGMVDCIIHDAFSIMPVLKETLEVAMNYLSDSHAPSVEFNFEAGVNGRNNYDRQSTNLPTVSVDLTHFGKQLERFLDDTVFYGLQYLSECGLLRATTNKVNRTEVHLGLQILSQYAGTLRELDEKILTRDVYVPKFIAETENFVCRVPRPSVVPLLGQINPRNDSSSVSDLLEALT